MVDFFVNATAGDDSNSGTTPDQAFQSITRATELAAALPADATGVIHVAEGIYSAPLERFTLIVPPGFDLQGAGRDLTIIRFTGRSRTVTGTSLVAWDGAALMAGNGVRDLTIEAEAVPAAFTCIGIDAILMDRSGLNLENVTIRARDPARRNRFRSSTFGSFGMRATQVLCQNTGHLGGGDPSFIRDCSFENSSTGAGNGGEVVNCTLRGASSIGTKAGSSAFIFNNVLHGPRTFIQVSSDPDSMAPPGPGPGPRVESNRISVSSGYGIYCTGPGTAQISWNRIWVNQLNCVGVLCQNGATPVFQHNRIGSDGVWAAVLLSVGTGAEPIFENNVFVYQRPGYYGGYFPIRLASLADFGGGARGSRGNNNFSGYRAKIYAELEGGGTIFAQNNFWWSAFRDSWRFETAEGTNVNIDGARHLRS